MADRNWRDDPEIRAAQAFARAHGKSAVIILHFAPGQVGVASYGRSGPICREAGKVADRLLGAITSGAADVGALQDAMEG